MTSGMPMQFPTHLGEVEELANWVRKAVHAHQTTTSNMTIDPYLIHLFVPPSFIVLKYIKMKTYENHFQIDNDQNSLLVTYDCGVTFVFQQSQASEDKVLGASQYVGTLKDILQLDYGLIFSPITLFQCQWMKNGLITVGTQLTSRMMLDFFLPTFSTSCMNLLSLLFSRH